MGIFYTGYLHRVLLILLLTFLAPDNYGKGVFVIDSAFNELDISAENISFALVNKNAASTESFPSLRFVPWNDSLTFLEPDSDHRIIFRVISCNMSDDPVELGISLSIPDGNVYYNLNREELRKAEPLNIRGLNVYGRISLSPGDSLNIFFLSERDITNLTESGRDLSIRFYNYESLLNRELKTRFVHSLLLGLLLFSAVLNLIIGLILQRRSFVSLFLYLMSLLLFAFSYLGFYDEFFSQNRHIPIGLPVYFLTLVLFLQVSKRYLQLEKNLPAWNTVTNVFMFFLALSIPYYYLTVYVERFYNSYLAFSSLFFFTAAAFLGLIESFILFNKEAKAKYFLIANLTVVISLALNIFLENRYPVVVGSVIQGFIFTIGLAEEIKILDQQKHRYQQSLISQLEVNLKLKDNLTIELENKVEERTKELKYANNELREKNNIVEQQKELLEIRNKEIKDSIEYAKRIQTASFPSRKILERVTRDYFIFYKPRDIVSGDFYWFGEVDDKVIVIASDCTGHGVPGAFMSMYGIAFLNEIVNKERIYNPSEILNTLRDKITSSLNRGDDEYETMDGMDVSAITFDRANSRILFAGAFNSLYFIRNEELQVINADKMPVAFYQKMDPFTLHELEMVKGDAFYIYTDGLIDQFGGAEGKKFLSKRLRDILLQISHLSMKEQFSQLEQAFNDWKGNYFQVDDILMIGLRI